MDLNEQDTLIAHTNSDAIRAANGNESKKVTITKDQLDEMTSNDEEEKPKSTRRNKKEETEDLEETPTEEVEVEDSSFEL